MRRWEGAGVLSHMGHGTGQDERDVWEHGLEDSITEKEEHTGCQKMLT